jgi:hypothetical protein
MTQPSQQNRETQLVICQDVKGLRNELLRSIETLTSKAVGLRHDQIICISTQSPLALADKNPRSVVPVHDDLKLGSFILCRHIIDKQRPSQIPIKVTAAEEATKLRYPVVLLVCFSDSEDDDLIRSASATATSAIYIWIPCHLPVSAFLFFPARPVDYPSRSNYRTGG